MVKIKVFSLAVAVAFLAFSTASHAQRVEKVWRIGYLSDPERTGVQSSAAVFRRAMNALGYVEGRNIVIKWPASRWRSENVLSLARELLQSGVDVIMAPSTMRALAAKKVTKNVPIVFMSAVDPVAAGLVQDLARPGGNLTGFTHIAPELAGKRLGLLKEVKPGLDRVAVLWQPGNLGSEYIWGEIQRAAPKLELRLHSMEITRSNQLESAFQEALKAGSGALAVALSDLINKNRKEIAAFAIKFRLPAIYSRSRPVRTGGLMSYEPDRRALYRRAAGYVHKILTGEKPENLPVQLPKEFRLVINLNAAKALGVAFPPSILLRATEIIQ